MVSLRLIIILETFAIHFCTAGEMDGISSSSNSNLQATGSGNKGFITSTSNLVLLAHECDLEIESTSNAKIEARRTKLNSQSDSNLLLNGINSTVTLESNSKLIISVERSDIKIRSSSDMNLVATSSRLKLYSNSNTDINTSDSSIVAENNQNLKIVSKGGRMVAKNTKNHTIRRYTGNKLEVVLEFSKDDSFLHKLGKYFMSRSNEDSNSPCVNTYITFQNEVEIDGRKYKLDNFNFTLEPISGSLFSIEMSEYGDEEIMTGRVVGSDEYELTLTNGNEIRVLSLHAPSIVNTKTIPPFNFVVDMDGGANSKL